MTPFTGIDLDCLRAGRRDAGGVVTGVLVTLNDRDGSALVCLSNRAGQERGLTRPWAGDEIEGRQPQTAEIPSVLLGKAFILPQNIMRQLHETRATRLVTHDPSGAPSVSMLEMVERVTVVMVM